MDSKYGDAVKAVEEMDKQEGLIQSRRSRK